MLTQILISSLQLLTTFYMTIVLLRFLLQLARADFYNPITQFVVKATNPVLRPLRKIIPPWHALDGASLLLAILVQALCFILILIAQTQSSEFFSLTASNASIILTIFAWSIVTVLGLILRIYYWTIIAVVILSWIAPTNTHPATQLLAQLTEPVLRPFRRLLPPMGGLDLSPIIAFLAIQVASLMVGYLARGVGMGQIGVMF
ncbi:YggT family protein [Mangrovitalea sediminis]|uniref:YggT family protein n=1 Tax=Mangrovitalea sediminis TaxID=1982043 RepID=UPI000BE4C32A|nr:YggT family protein [Mangrovitalea sediminis]